MLDTHACRIFRRYEINHIRYRATVQRSTPSHCCFIVTSIVVAVAVAPVVVVALSYYFSIALYFFVWLFPVLQYVSMFILILLLLFLFVRLFQFGEFIRYWQCLFCRCHCCCCFFGVFFYQLAVTQHRKILNEICTNVYSRHFELFVVFLLKNKRYKSIKGSLNDETITITNLLPFV